MFSVSFAGILFVFFNWDLFIYLCVYAKNLMFCCSCFGLVVSFVFFFGNGIMKLLYYLGKLCAKRKKKS